MSSKMTLDRRSLLKGTAAAVGTTVAAPFVLRKTARASDQSITIMNTFPTLANEYWQGWDAGAKQACAQLGLKYVSQTYEDSVEKQISQIEQAPSLGVNAVVTFAQNAEIIKALAKTAKQVGVILANAHSTAAWLDPADPAFEGTYMLYSQPDNIRGVAAMANVLFKKIGGEGDVMYVAGLPGNFSADTRAAGVQQALAENPKIRLVAQENGGENRIAARPVVENLLTAHPDVKAIVSYNADTAIAVLDVLRDRGLSGKVFTNGVDETSEMLSRIKNDPSALGTVGINGPFMTGYSAVTLYDALEGVKTDPLENMRFFDSMLIDTPEAAAKFSSLMDPEKPLPFDFKAMSRHLNGDKWTIQWGMEIIDPRKLWASVSSMASTKPANWSVPENVAASLDAGNVEKLNAMYRAHYKAGPLGEAIALTRTKSTVLGF
jgi:ABC-type sugar transport system substrate-binding protein